MATPKISIPTVHLNGSNGPTMVADLREAFDAVREACNKVCECAPHGRDYYVQGPDAYSKAAKEHLARVDAMRKIQDELIHIAMGIQEQER